MKATEQQELLVRMNTLDILVARDNLPERTKHIVLRELVLVVGEILKSQITYDEMPGSVLRDLDDDELDE